MNPIPTITLNMLEEYRIASPKKKLSILKTFKFPDEKFKTNRYNSVKGALIAFLTNKDHDVKVFEERRNRLLQRKRDTPWRKRDVENSLLALKNIEQYANRIFGRYFKYEIVSNRQQIQKIRTRKIKGVVVQMNPELILKKKGTDEIVGVIKLVFTKDKKMTPMKGQVVSGFIKEFVEKEFKNNADVTNFMAFDVFHKNPVTANTEFALQRRMINKVLEEINATWDLVKK